MLLADSCFNITHDSFMNDLDETLQRAENHKIKYFFAPASKESEIENLLHYCKVYEGKVIALLVYTLIMLLNLNQTLLLI